MTLKQQLSSLCQPLLFTCLLAGSVTALNAAESDPAANQDKAQGIPLEEIRLFTEVFERIKNAYVEPVDDAKLLEDAVRGMLAGLDPHSVYLEPEAFTDLQSHTSGEFGGLGIEVGMEDGFVRVITPIDDTPAERAGVKAGDLIIKLGDQPVQGMDLNDAVKLMRGKPGSELILTVVRDGEDKPLEITVVRDVIRVASVKKRMLDSNVGYLRITQFQVNTAKDLTRAVEKLTKQNELQGIVLDLRNNPGGVLRAAVEVSDAFLEQGLIVYTQGRLPNSELRYNATSATLIGAEIPLVVLINQGSASASEIVAGALQDQGRAVIMGVDSFGKGSVQTILPLNKDRAVKLTTARYYTPDGRSIQAQGIVPDIYVGQADISLKESGDFIKERDLSGHLENGENNGAKQADTKASLAETDFQLYEALNLLKALAIVKTNKVAEAEVKAEVEAQPVTAE
ncbi:S41 family peptidase [Amphritea balenae]|uniref:S41 family peptidase n=1 Tax=Amphritea balenae TaxID=452629 RepID=A0A3P1SJR1_9GAMM|nr:S41 family peptidase [Amphritea balenae]RRC97523.1 S41 family peptidase [Amphritea balenae]GGK74375.1 carboxyl-terminal protease [Amphritea balenae]